MIPSKNRLSLIVCQPISQNTFHIIKFMMYFFNFTIKVNYFTTSIILGLFIFSKKYAFIILLVFNNYTSIL